MVFQEIAALKAEAVILLFVMAAYLGIASARRMRIS